MNFQLDHVLLCHLTVLTQGEGGRVVAQTGARKEARRRLEEAGQRRLEEAGRRRLEAGGVPLLAVGQTLAVKSARVGVDYGVCYALFTYFQFFY
jgi:hypothetical protein